MIAPDPRAEERVGSVLHEKWTLERLLGVGGMGAVYAARHRNGARAAVKVLSPSMGRLPHIRKRFLHEGYAANRVDHAGAVKVLDDDVIQDGSDEGTAYLVMELLEGEPLSDRAKREPPLTERDLLEIADGVLAVLAAAHSNGVVHRDLKPDNLFLARDPEREGTYIKVLDFGLARLLEAQELTIAGMALGTPTYMSPEQASGKVEDIDGRTDIYALGSILFQLATNKRIHDAAHTLGLVVRMATTPAPKVQTVAPDVSDTFARIVDRALEFKREDRYADAAAMRADVQAALALLPSDASTVHVIPASQPPPALDVRGLPPAPTSPALADTVRVPAVATAPSPENVGRAVDDRQEHTAPRARQRPAQRPRQTERSSLRSIVVLFVLGLGGVLLWSNRSTIERVFGSPPAASSTVTSAPSSSAAAVNEGDAAPPPLDAAIDVELPLEDASTLVVALDAALEEPLDASADASDDDEEEDEDEELDASLEASAPQPSPTSTASPRRGGTHTVTKPPQKKRPPRRPGHPRRKKRRRF
ncbi:MAG TPA: serine/threonine-protein kinase [Labilithrix sp.]|nr:serine/threonine-protein kinase [Labilithrix sp.]